MGLCEPTGPHTAARYIRLHKVLGKPKTDQRRRALSATFARAKRLLEDLDQSLRWCVSRESLTEAIMSRAGNVLIVDDDEECRSSLGEVLESEGCTVYTAENGKQALEVLAVIHPDLVIVDLMMPVMNGWELCAELEKDARLATIPVAVLTAVGRMRPVGQKHVLQKPVTLPTLVALLDLIDTASDGR